MGEIFRVILGWDTVVFIHLPIKMTGLFVAATAESAPPPFACPSNLDMTTDPTSTLSLNARD